ncbi:RHS repeat protein [Pseudomonas sp. GM17]|uniref:RHS repeat protein n=1 Tax=Pseudomonas sp. GM17 TaxID=1144323 RepID=UPI0002FB3AF4|nr:RHS repeat protein [Pseudomonas sp. GM17]WIE48611.1 RHS repeat protein [Pseudomonas sp. GM17]
MNSSYYTQTPNFISATSNDVDPRTRLFGFQQSLGKVTGNNGMGPELDLMMTYSPTSSTDDFLLGIGVVFSFTTYDKNSSTLSLDTGEVFKVLENTGTADTYFEIKQQKIKTFVAQKLDAKNYRVISRNGNVTDLRDIGGGSCRPIKIYSPLGNILTLDWGYDNFGRSYLARITDSTDTLYSAVYDNKYKYLTITFWPETSESYSLVCYTGNGYLTQITSTALPTNASWRYFYKEVGVSGLYTLFKTQTPTGLTKEAIYNNGLTDCIMAFPDEANLPPLPAVTSLTVNPGQGQSPIVTTYAPTKGYFPNYLGYGGKLGASWSPDSDNLYGVLDADYQYQTTVTQLAVDGGSDLVTKYTYDSYHLLLSTEANQGSTRHVTEMSYYAQGYASFDEQPAQFQYPFKQVETWTDTSLPAGGDSRSETTLFEYDVDGNLIKQTSPDQAVTTWEYYAAAGEINNADESTGCPADPNGFVRWIKAQTTYPPLLSGYYDVPTRAVRYRYTSATTINDSPLGFAVLPAQETFMQLASASTLEKTLHRQLLSYQTDTTSPDYGKVKKVLLSMPSTAGDDYVQTIDIGYLLQNDTLIQSTTLTTHDNLCLSSSRSNSRFTDQLRSHTDELGNKKDFTYDDLGRLSSWTHNAGTDYEVSYKQTYSLNVGSDGIASAIYTIHTDEKGNAWEEHVDGMGRPITRKSNDVDNGIVECQFTISTVNYDGWGRPYEQVATDYLDTSDASRTVAISTSALFDDWGQQYLAQYTSGQSACQLFDPVNHQSVTNLQVISGNLTLGSQRTDFNVQGLPIAVSNLDSTQAQYSQSFSEFDGLQRLRKQTDELGNITLYSYDEFDRLMTQTLPDQSTVTRTYAPFSTSELPITITVTDPLTQKTVTMGQQTFDGLGRLTGSSCGGRTLASVYSGVNQVPTTTTDAAGQTLTYSYIPQLGNALSTVAGGALAQSFSYEKATGRLLSASESGSQSESRTWSASGQLNDQQFTPISGLAREVGYAWSLQGLPLSYCDIRGNTQTITYDAYGRPQTLVDPQVTVALTYDDAGRLSTQIVTANSAGDTLKTVLSWDDFSREVQRDIVPSTGETLTIKQAYRKNHQLECRTVLQGSTSTSLRHELFSYDNRNRLTQYTCSGSVPPVDAYGKPIAEQKFTLDVYSNIKTCVTTLADGSIDTASYEFTNADDPTQLTAVTHTLTSHYPLRIDLKYDANGRMTVDETGRVLTYDVAGRLSSISGEDGMSQYGYDGFDQLVMQSLNGNETRQLYYQGSHLVNEVHLEQNQHSRFIPGATGHAAVSDEPLQ